MVKKLILYLSLLFFIPFILAQISENDRVLKVGVESGFDLFNPWQARVIGELKIFWNVLEPLVALEENNTKIKPYLATSWRASNNNRNWIFKLREGVRFHDGSILRADDVIASASVFSQFEEKVEKIDNLTVRFTLPQPNSGFLHKIASSKCPIAPSNTINRYKLLEKQGRLEEFIPVGSGPFKFSRWEKGKQIVLESFDDYWQGSPWLEKIVYQIIPNNKERLSALEKGEIDLIDIILPADLLQIKKKPNLKVLSIYGMNVCYIELNTTRKPLDNIKVRKALNLAINKMRLTKMFYFGGYGAPTNRILSPAFWGFSALPNPGRYKPKEAKRMLTEAGYENGFTLKFIYIPEARPYAPDPSGMAEEIKKQLSKVGVDVQITVPADFSEFFSMATSGEFDLVMSGWINLTGDPDFTLDSLLSGKLYQYNFSFWHNELFDEKLKAARELPISDVTGKIQLYNDAQKIFQQEAPWIPLAHTRIFVIHNRKVMGIILYPNTIISYHNVIVES